MQLRALREEQVEAERIILATQSALDADAELLSEEEHKEIVRLIDAVRAQIASLGGSAAPVPPQDVVG